jgi:hypothetical protein
MNPIRKIFERIINPVTLYEDSSSGGGAPQTNITNTNSAPWKPTIKYWNNEQSVYNPKTGQYVLNKKPKAPMGVLQQTANFANTYGTLSPEEQQLMTGYQDTLGGRGIGIGNMQDLGTNLQNDLTGGRYNTNFDYVSDPNVSLGTTANADVSLGKSSLYDANLGTATRSDLVNARLAQGQLDPTAALSQILRGDPSTNPYLAQMNQASINQSMQGYNDMLQKANQTLLPQIKQDAFASGQYGGSRQGVAEGIIGQQLGINARDLGQKAMDTGASLYGGAFENAQQRMAAAAGDINTQAGQNEQYNATNLQNMALANMGALNEADQFNATNLQNMALANMGAQNEGNQFNALNLQNMNLANMGALNEGAQYNADLALKNRAQGMEQMQNNLNNALQAYNVGKATYADVTAAQDALYGTQTDVEKTQLQRTLDMLNTQAGIYGTASGLGGHSTSMGTSSAPSGGGGGSSTVGNILGGLSGATGLLSMAGGGGLGGVGGIIGSFL